MLLEIVYRLKNIDTNEVSKDYWITKKAADYFCERENCIEIKYTVVSDYLIFIV